MMVVNGGETADDTARPMMAWWAIEVLINMRGRRGARNRVLRAVPAGKRHSASAAAGG
jgi:hypothetical protein